MSAGMSTTPLQEELSRALFVPLFPIAVARYHQMIDQAILEEDDPVELLEHVVVEKGTAAPWRFSVEKYHEMIQNGILTEDDPVELIDGLLVEKMPTNPPHALTNKRLRKAIEKRLPAGWEVYVQDPITLEGSEPEPDLTVVEGEDAKFAMRHPGPADIALVTEISDSTLSLDRGPKKRLYARARIRRYWIVNLIDTKVEVYTDPGITSEGPDYLKHEDFGIGQEVAFDVGGQNVVIPAAEFLPVKEPRQSDQ